MSHEPKKYHLYLSLIHISGTDHAAISTEVKVTNQLKEEGIDKYYSGHVLICQGISGGLENLKNASASAFYSFSSVFLLTNQTLISSIFF